MRFSDLYTLASGLTLFRFGIGAVVPFLGTGHVLLWVYVVALVTDVLDGALARRWGRATSAGATLDAWADKVLHVNLAWSLAVSDVIPGWWMWLWFSRELVQAPTIPLLVHRWRTGAAEPRTSGWGRATAIALAVATILAILGQPSPVLTALTGALGMVAGADYAWRHVVVWRGVSPRGLPPRDPPPRGLPHASEAPCP